MKEMKETILAKLSVEERRAFNILNNKELCERMKNETPYGIEDFVKEYNIPKETLRKLVAKGVISSFSNINNPGSKIFIFKEETLKAFKLSYNNTQQLFNSINGTIELYLLLVKDSLPQRDYEIIYDALINGMSYENMSKKYKLSEARIGQIYGKTKMRIRRMMDTILKHGELESEYEVLKYEVRDLKHKRKVLSQEKLLEKENFKIHPLHSLFSQKMVDLNISVRLESCLRTNDVETLGEVISLKREELLKFRNFGKGTLIELEDLVASKGLQLGTNLPELYMKNPESYEHLEMFNNHKKKRKNQNPDNPFYVTLQKDHYLQDYSKEKNPETYLVKKCPNPNKYYIDESIEGLQMTVLLEHFEQSKEYYKIIEGSRKGVLLLAERCRKLAK